VNVVYWILLVVGTAASWGFVGYYATTYRWWLTEIGRHLITMSSIVGAFYLYFLVFLVWPALPGRAVIRFALFVALTATLVWRLAVFSRHRLAERTERQNGPERWS
jgi:hypothetical protein